MLDTSRKTVTMVHRNLFSSALWPVFLRGSISYLPLGEFSEPCTLQMGMILAVSVSPLSLCPMQCLIHTSCPVKGHTYYGSRAIRIWPFLLRKDLHSEKLREYGSFDFNLQMSTWTSSD